MMEKNVPVTNMPHQITRFGTADGSSTLDAVVDSTSASASSTVHTALDHQTTTTSSTNNMSKCEPAMAPLNCESSLHSSDSSSNTSTTIHHTTVNNNNNNNNNESLSLMQDSPKPPSKSSSFEDKKCSDASNDEEVVNHTGDDKGVSPDTDENGANTNFTHTFLKSILSSIDSKDPVVANAWLETLLDVIDLLSKEIIREEVLPVAVAKSQLQEVSAKIASCKLIGKLSNKFEPNVLRQELSGAVQSLCQDVSPEVRSAICEVLATVAIGLGLDTTKSLILPELVNLCSDEHISVRAGALNALVDMLPILDSATRCDTIIPLVKKVCEGSLKNKDSCLPLCAHLLGPLCHTLRGDMDAEDKKCLLDFYSKLAVIGQSKDSGEKNTEDIPPSDGNPPSPTLSRLEGDCREQCAFNYPGMVLFTLGVPLSAITLAGSPAGEFLPPSPLNSCDPCHSSGDSSPLKETLIPILCSFAADTSIPVRVVVAKSFHQICLILGGDAILLREALLTLLHSDSLEVLSALLPSLPMVLQMLHTHHVTPTGSKEEMVSVLLRLEDRVSASCGGVWRTHADVLHHMSRLVTFLPHTIVSEQLIPRMRERMASARALPCRVSAARTLLVYFQHLPEGEKQQQVANAIVKEFCQSSSCHHRMLYLTVCGLCVELLPHQIFKSYFSTPMIAMHADRVPNIRLRLVSLLPLVKASLQLPADKTLLQSLETAVGSLLLTETDKDVCSAVSRIIVDLENISLKGSIERTTPEGIEALASYSEDISTQSDVTEVSGSSSNSSQKNISYSKEDNRSAKKFDSTEEGNKNVLPTFIPKIKKDTSIPSGHNSKLKSPSTPSRNSVLRSSGRRAAGACNLPSYVGGRRLSAVLPPPKLPPDKSTVMRSQRNSESFHEEDLRQLCDQVLHSPQDQSTNFPWDEVIDPSATDKFDYSHSEFEPEYHDSEGVYGDDLSRTSDAVSSNRHYSHHYYDETNHSDGYLAYHSRHGNLNENQERFHFNYPSVSMTSISSNSENVIAKAQQKLEQATGGFKLAKDIVKLGSQLVTGDGTDNASTSSSTSSESISTLGVFSTIKPSYRNKSPDALPPIPSTQALLANICKQDPTNFTEEAWQTCKLGKDKLCDKIATYREKATNISSKELFWLRSSRPRWRRKVASADTSPEEQNRIPLRFTRGLSEDSAQQRNMRFYSKTLDDETQDTFMTAASSFSYEDSEDITDVSKYSAHIHKLASDLDGGENASPPSPHGMYTWPPQHARHKHQTSVEESERDKNIPTSSDENRTSGTRNLYQHPDKLETRYDPEKTYDSNNVDRNNLQSGTSFGKQQYGDKRMFSFNSTIGGLGYREASIDYSTSGKPAFSVSKSGDTCYSSSYKAEPTINIYDSQNVSSSNVAYDIDTRKKFPDHYMDNYHRKTDSKSIDYDDLSLGGRPQYPLPSFTRASSESKYDYSYRINSYTDDSRNISNRQIPQSTSHPDISSHNNTEFIDQYAENVHDREFYSRPYSRTSSPNTAQLHQIYRDKYLDRYGNPHSSGNSSTSPSHGRQIPSMHYASSTISRSGSGMPSRYRSTDRKACEDLYVVHGIPPTIAMNDRSDEKITTRTSSYHSKSFSEQDPNYVDKTKGRIQDSYLPDYYSKYDHVSRSRKDIYSKDTSYETVPDKLGSRYRYRSYSNDRVDPPYDNYSEKYGFYDSGEFASRSSCSAYPIGPLGASWIHQGMNSSLLSSNASNFSSKFSPHCYTNTSNIPTSPWSMNPQHSSSPSLSSLDPTTDEFLVDAGIRIDESTLRSRLPTPHSSRNAYSSDFVGSPSNRIQRPVGGSRLRPPTPSSHMSKLSVDSLCGNMSTEQSSFTRARAGSGRNPRPVSTSDGTCSTNVPTTSRTKSLSHENLRLTPHSGSHLPNDSVHGSKNSLGNRNDNSLANASRSPSSRLTYSSNKPTSCSSSPGASRCTSPGIPISSPPSSRCSSPGGTIVRIGSMGSARTNKSAFVPVSSFSSHKSPSDSVSPTTPPSPAPQERSSSSGSQMSSNRRSSNSRLPLPTHRHR